MIRVAIRRLPIEPNLLNYESYLGRTDFSFLIISAVLLGSVSGGIVLYTLQVNSTVAVQIEI